MASSERRVRVRRCVQHAGLALALLLWLAQPAKADEPLRQWRIIMDKAAPWAVDAHADPDLLGRRLTVSAAEFAGLGDWHCGQVLTTPTQMPAEGLFQGNLPMPAEAVARALGFPSFPVAGFSLQCDAGLFEFHRLDDESWMLAWNNRLLTLSQAEGAFAPASDAAAVVEAFLEGHFARQCVFDESVSADWWAHLSADLLGELTRYLAAEGSADEAPVLDGDPFTDSQEPPLRFAVGATRMQEGVAYVPVRLHFFAEQRELTYVLRRETTGWRIDDVQPPQRASLRQLLLADQHE